MNKQEIEFNCKAIVGVWLTNNAKKVNESKELYLYDYKNDGGATISIQVTKDNAGMELSNILYNNIDSSKVELVARGKEGEIIIGSLNVKHSK